MENKYGASASYKRSYIDFDPFCKWRKDDECEILEIHLHDFRKENLRVQINNRDILTVSGEHPSGGDTWSRFRKEIKVSNDCDVDQIRAKLSAGILTISMPKKSPTLAEKPPSVQDPKPQEHAELKQRKDKKMPDDSRGSENDVDGKNGPRLLWRLRLNRKTKFLGLLLALLVMYGTYVAYKKMCNGHVEV